MLLQPLPEYGITHWQVFNAVQDTNTNRGWQTWLKPIGASHFFIEAIAGGGGGGGGQSTAAAARTGGGGGATAAVTRLYIPAFAMPDVLYIRAGSGGGGGAAANTGSTGINSYVSVASDNTSQALLISCAPGTGGASTGGGGSGGSAATTGSFAAWGVPVSVAGQAGAAGGANTGAVGSDITPPTTTFLTAGAGGAGSSTGNNVFAGGGILVATAVGPALWNAKSGGAAGVSGTTPGGDGKPGLNHGIDIGQLFSRSVPLIFSGGTGGGSGGASNGGKGGDGAYGCGGGGGGAGATGGAGGKGGDGFVIIGAF